MIELVETEEFSDWLSNLKDSKARTRVQTRLDRLALGNPGDVKSVAAGVSEMRINYGPGYRVYFCRRGKLVILLLAGGDKRTQKKDIAKAVTLLDLVRREDGEVEN